MNRLSIFLCVVFTACITSYEPNIDNHQPNLVVDGMITNKKGPHYIRLSFSTKYANDETVFQNFISDAEVFIEDNMGGKEIVTLERSGYYKTSTEFQGKEGIEYTLKIRLADGREYASNPELMRPVPKIDTVYTVYEQFNRGFLRGEFKVYLNTLDPQTKDDFYRWNWTHYRQTPYCREIVDSYSGFTYARKCCEPCWAIERCDGCINIMSDKYINGRQISQVPLLTIPYDTKESYFLHVEQMSISRNAYSFWKAVSEQINNTGGIFDKPPVAIKGNMVSVTNPEEQVLGFFGASAIYDKFIYIERNGVINSPFGTPVIYKELTGCAKCSVGPYRTNQKPEGWD